jgi:NADH:ubiquinone oxidoreductase subunit D
VLEQGDDLMTGNEIVRARAIGVGYPDAGDAINLSTAGPLLRASGVPYDIRRAEPYSYYDKLDFDVAVRYNGDIYDRYLIRMDEMRQSLRILGAGIAPSAADTARRSSATSRSMPCARRAAARPTAAWRTRRGNWAIT